MLCFNDVIKINANYYDAIKRRDAAVKHKLFMVQNAAGYNIPNLGCDFSLTFGLIYAYHNFTHLTKRLETDENTRTVNRAEYFIHAIL